MSSSKFSGPFMQKSVLTPLQGNAFIKAKMDAEAAGKSSFSVDGKDYPLKMEAEESPLGNHHPPVDVEAMAKKSKQRADSIYKDIGGYKGMKKMQVKKKLKKDDEDTGKDGKLAFSKKELAKFAADRKRDAKFRTSKADDSVMNKK